MRKQELSVGTLPNRYDELIAHETTRTVSHTEAFFASCFSRNLSFLKHAPQTQNLQWVEQRQQAPVEEPERRVASRPQYTRRDPNHSPENSPSGPSLARPDPPAAAAATSDKAFIRSRHTGCRCRRPRTFFLGWQRERWCYKDERGLFRRKGRIDGCGSCRDASHRVAHQDISRARYSRRDNGRVSGRRAKRSVRQQQ